MCDQDQLARWAKNLNRRQFGVLGATGALAACTANGGMGESDAAMSSGSSGLVEDNISFRTADGTMDAFFVRPASGPSPAVIMWPDIAGVREAKRMMARRTAAEGFAVLLVNPYYRDVTGEQFADFAEFAANSGFQKVKPWRDKLSSQAIMRDTTSIVNWLDALEFVDTDAGIGAEGYCMGGPFTVYSAAAVPSRVKAAASFHGGGLVREDADSPHKLIPRTDASFLFAIAQDDDAKQPEAKTALREAAEAASRDAVVDVYAADHGWTVPDAPAYDRAEAERAYAAKMRLYDAL